MFKITPNPTFAATVEIAVPGEKAAKLKLVFRHKTRDQAKEFFHRVSEEAKNGSDDGSPASRERKVLEEIVAGWEDVDQPFSGDALELVLLNYHNASSAILDAYMEQLTQARRGN
ncbi:phage tail assembly chaperone [Cupriavidus pampae]|uniref:Phage protein n=1 Tax=Cupriavidus pampae TaxID=659251 RepID=A0ABM8XCD5_9BURK|nr:phage tail assembly chaperone [Cupriavidus pampae]CAG9177758.1 hypothetical protein LMG32289_03897 [Cupriavidus pampae]